MNKIISENQALSVSQVLFNNYPQALLFVDQFGKIAKANVAAKILFGGEEFLLAKSILDFFESSQRILVRSLLKDVELGELDDQRWVELKIKGVKGIEEAFHLNMQRVVDDEEQGIIITIKQPKTEDSKKQDSVKTQKPPVEAPIANSQELYRIVSRNFPNGVISVFDTNFNYLFAEGKELYRMGITSERLVGTNYLNRLPSDIQDEVRAKLLEVLAGKNQTFEISYKNSHYILNATGLENDGIINRILLVEINITQQKRAEAEIKKAFEKERQLNELKSRFVAMASHEFRTPLSTILSSTNLIMKYLEHPQGREKIIKHGQKVMTSVKNLTGILNDFLSIDKLDEGKLELKPIKFDLCQMVVNMSESVEDSLKEGQEFQLILPSEQWVYQDPNIFRNILLNLFTNAIKYSHEHQEIVVRIWQHKNRVVLEVQDEGIGIPEEEQSQLFQRFFRAKNAFNLQGTGLGLNIVQKYVSLINGKISFLSKEQEGTTFTINFPKTYKNEEGTSH